MLENQSLEEAIIGLAAGVAAVNEEVRAYNLRECLPQWHFGGLVVRGETPESAKADFQRIMRRYGAPPESLGEPERLEQPWSVVLVAIGHEDVVLGKFQSNHDARCTRRNWAGFYKKLGKSVQVVGKGQPCSCQFCCNEND